MPVSAPASPAPSVKIGFAAEGRQLQVVARGAECRALRTKIGRLIDHHEDLHTLSNVSLAALLGFVGVLATRTLRSRASQPSFCLYLLVPPANFSVCVDRSDLRRGILQLAHYIDKLATNANQAFRTLGPNDPTDGIAVWDRERWKAKEFSRKDGGQKRAVTYLEKPRWLALAVPGYCSSDARVVRSSA